MLTLLDWLNTRHLVGRRDEFVCCLVGVALLGALSLHMLGVAHMRATDRIDQAAIEPVRPSAIPGLEALKRTAVPLAEGEDFATARHCLAQAIYFEARGEPVSGWSAVADVVINRVKDSRYPDTICGVVFQGEYRRHRCQFSFACDGRSDRAKNRRFWHRALRVAENKLRYYRDSPTRATANATHYHADYVSPHWSRKMVRLAKIGNHIFYTDKRDM